MGKAKVMHFPTKTLPGPSKSKGLEVISWEWPINLTGPLVKPAVKTFRFLYSPK